MARRLLWKTIGAWAGMRFHDLLGLTGARPSRAPLSEGWAADGQRLVSDFSLNQCQNTKRKKNLAVTFSCEVSDET